ncbi:helix-turn-helix domain-containing protein [Modestobacter sp. SYSU DS0290]
MPTTSTKPRADDPLWSDERAAEYLGVSRVTVRRMRAAGDLPTVKVRGAARTPRSAVLAYVARQIG